MPTVSNVTCLVTSNQAHGLYSIYYTVGAVTFSVDKVYSTQASGVSSTVMTVTYSVAQQPPVRGPLL